MASSYGAMEDALRGAPRSGAGEAGPGRRVRLLALGALLCLFAAAATHGYVSHAGLQEAVLQEPQMLWGGRGGPTALPTSFAAAPSARRSELADFEPAKLYKDPPETDHDHGNRIDNYACMFSDCEGTKTPLLQTGIQPVCLQGGRSPRRNRGHTTQRPVGACVVGQDAAARGVATLFVLTVMCCYSQSAQEASGQAGRCAAHVHQGPQRQADSDNDEGHVRRAWALGRPRRPRTGRPHRSDWHHRTQGTGRFHRAARASRRRGPKGSEGPHGRRW